MEEILDMPRGCVYLQTDNDDVFDFINALEDDVKSHIYRGLDQYPDSDTNINFSIMVEGEPLYGFIHKFCLEGDSGLIYALCKDYVELAEFANQKFEGELGAEIAKQIIVSNEDV
jgi:hypothetical protein